jgi:hypothetical protein
MLMARLAHERAAREHAAAQLRQLRNLVAVLMLEHGQEAGRRAFLDYEETIVRQSNI